MPAGIGYPRDRKRTLQGGFGRPTVGNGQPNVRGAGIMQGFLGANPVAGFGTARNGVTKGLGAIGRGRPGGIGPGGPQLGGGGGGRRMTPPGGPQRGGGKGKGKGRGGGFGGGRTNALGLPLDPMFEMDRRMARDSLQAQMTQLRNSRATGLAGLAEEEMLGNRAIDEDVAARGLYGSGIERRDERLLGNDVARAKMDMLSQFTTGQSGATMDFRRAMQDALLGLGRRNQGNRFLGTGLGGGKKKRKRKKNAGGPKGGRRGGREIPRGGRGGRGGR